MERIAYQNMTSNSKHSFEPDPMIGQLTMKQKIDNRNIDEYYLDRQNKNSPLYNSYVDALNSNISEDRTRTKTNNDLYMNNISKTSSDNCQRVYHPTLMTGYEHQFSNADRCGLGIGTRDHSIDSFASNPNLHNDPFRFTMNNTSNDTSNVSVPMPKLGYPEGYGGTNMNNMDMTSCINQQFNKLTDYDMDRQIQMFNGKTQQPLPQNSFDRDLRCMIDPNYKNHQVDYMNQQIHQLSGQLTRMNNLDSNKLMDFQMYRPPPDQMIISKPNISKPNNQFVYQQHHKDIKRKHKPTKK